MKTKNKAKCVECGGDGWRFHEPNSAHTRECKYCGGTGEVNKKKKNNK